MTLPDHKTKIVCTIGPASDSPEMLRRIIRAGMDVARLNFSHGDFESHAQTIGRIREAANAVGRRVAIMADLPGPKIRVGEIRDEPVQLAAGDKLTLSTDEFVGDAEHVSVSFAPLPRVVHPGDKLFINDGIIQLEVVDVTGNDVKCEVRVGGELRSRKGLNVPDIDLGIGAFTDHDRECLQFALEHGVDAVSQSFVESPEDMFELREAAEKTGKQPFLIAKIERSRALSQLDEILDAADGIMIARGDLGVEIPIEEIAVVQKKLTRLANLRGKPVITATQMLESMTVSPRPTRAESTDVANAILDGTDCVMLSGESAMGKYPVESVRMLARIAAAVEPHRPRDHLREHLASYGDDGNVSLRDLIALSVVTTADSVSPAAVVCPTRSGASAQSISRFRLPVWIIAVSRHPRTIQKLHFSYGVNPVFVSEHPDDWNEFARDILAEYEIEGNLVILTEGPSVKHPEANNRMEIIDLNRKPFQPE